MKDSRHRLNLPALPSGNNRWHFCDTTSGATRLQPLAAVGVYERGATSRLETQAGEPLRRSMPMSPDAFSFTRPRPAWLAGAAAGALLLWSAAQATLARPAPATGTKAALAPAKR